MEVSNSLYSKCFYDDENLYIYIYTLDAGFYLDSMKILLYSLIYVYGSSDVDLDKRVV